MTTEVQPAPAEGRTFNPPETSFKISPAPSNTPSNPPWRWWLSLQAGIWRFLGKIGAYLHTFPVPVPPQPSFIRRFSTNLVSDNKPAVIELAFYVPPEYWPRVQEGKRYPVVVNLHGGGFTLGTARDDGRWAAIVLQEVDAIFVSVEYRLAPEFPFPTAVEDGVEALLHLAANADVFGIDSKKMALSGFSAGGNLAFSIPLRLQAHLQLIMNEVQSNFVSGNRPTPPLPQIVSIIAWYPSLDNRLTRAERIAACPRPEKTLPPILTNLFDKSYFAGLDNNRSPYASPSAATDEALVTALPENVAIYLCEWDMLLQEGEQFAQRLEGLGKRIQCTVIKESRHAFDKSPYPFSVDPKLTLHYRQACGILSDAFAS